jgi:hypothetical protein
MPSRYRVPAGWLVGLLVVALARPTPSSLLLGVPLALVGEAVRLWASGTSRRRSGSRPAGRTPTRAIPSTSAAC